MDYFYRSSHLFEHVSAFNAVKYILCCLPVHAAPNFEKNFQNICRCKQNSCSSYSSTGGWHVSSPSNSVCFFIYYIIISSQHHRIKKNNNYDVKWSKKNLSSFRIFWIILPLHKKINKTSLGCLRIRNFTHLRSLVKIFHTLAEKCLHTMFGDIGH